MPDLQFKVEDNTDYTLSDYQIDYSKLVTEDDEPVDNWFSEKQQRLLAESINLSWKPGRLFIGAANVGIYYGIYLPPVVPDVFVSLDVKLPEDIWEKKNRCYMVWEFGKPPEAVIEIVSNKVGSERGKKFKNYEQMGVWYYVVYDPLKIIQKEELRIFELTALGYIHRIDRNLKKIGLSLTLWDGEYEGTYARWLRWCDAEGNLLLNGKEAAEQERQRADQEQQRADQERQRADQERQRADQEQQRADQEQQRADQERQRADQERQRAERLAQKLKELGIDPNETS